MAALIAARRADGIPVAVSCRALGVSRTWFYKHKDGRLPLRAQRRGQLKAEIARLFALHGGKYGSPRITADLREAGWQVSENTVAALMREQGLAARRKKKRKSTTRPARGRWRAPDLVKRDFPAAQVNTKWYGDGTEIPTGEGKLYLASVLDMASRRIVGFALGEHRDAQGRAGGASTWTPPALRRLHGSYGKRDQGKISPLDVSTLSGEPRRIWAFCSRAVRTGADDSGSQARPVARQCLGAGRHGARQ